MASLLRLPIVSPAVTAFATFALIGFYAALIPNLLAEALRLTSPVISGLVLAELFAVATGTVAATASLGAHTGMLGGLALLLPALALLVATELFRSTPLLVFAAAIAGVAGALGYRGCLEVVNRIAPADRRGETVSSYLIAVYAGNSLPVIGVGILSAAAGPLAAQPCSPG